MSDLNGDDLAKIGLTGGGVVVALVAAVKWLGGRNIAALDKTIEKLGETIAALTAEVTKLREAHIGLAKDVGALQEGQRSLAGRIEGQASFWHKQFEDHRALVHERMTKATHDMLDTVEQVTEAAKRKR